MCSVIHRADYHRVLWDEVVAAGVDVRLGTAVESIDYELGLVKLRGAVQLHADVIVGADGIFSLCRLALKGLLKLQVCGRQRVR
jgi:salicylate hydroxylase